MTGRSGVLASVLALTTVLEAAPAMAVQVNGAVLPDTIEVGGRPLHLNGCGTREAMLQDSYVIGLYLPEATSDREVIFSSATPKAIVARLIYRDRLPPRVSNSHDTVRRELAELDVRQNFLNMIDGLNAGDEVIIRYAPGQDVETLVNGQVRSTSSGPTMLQIQLRVWLSNDNASDNLYRLLLAGRCQPDVDDCRDAPLPDQGRVTRHAQPPGTTCGR